jgi:hypothetical protein
MITLQDLITSKGRYPDRANSTELTEELKANGKQLIEKVVALLTELGIKSIDISSGFRTSAANSATPSAAKKSLHMQCKAVDLLDDKAQSLGKLILSKPELLKKHGLWMEDLSATIGKNTNWVHLDIGNRADRPIRIFKP